MEWMGWLGWILAAAAGGAALYLSRRVAELSADRAAPTEARQAGTGPDARSGPPPEGEVGAVAGEDTLESAARRALDAEEEALRRALAFLDRAVRAPVEEARGLVAGGPAVEALERAMDAMGDLAFLAAPPPDEAVTEENLASVVQEAVREYTIETRIPVRLYSPEEPLHVRVRREALKDAVFLILANAGRFSEGRPIDVHLEPVEPGGFRVRVVDEGPGFTDEALERALEPFWTTDPLGVGMGLPQARSRIAAMKGRLSLRNQPPKGGEVVLEFPDR